MKLFKRLSLVAMLVSATALTPLIAQTIGDDPVPEAKLAIPDGQQLFGKNDPNVRRATAQVNGEIITGTDIDHRLALIVAANENKLPPEELARFRAQVLTNLIDETLQIQEAAANEIEVTDAEVNQYFDRVAQQNFNRPANEVEKYLISIGSSVATLKRQIKGELSWSRLLSRNVRPSANVSDDEVNAIIERIKATKGTTEYRLGEIYLSATPETMSAVTENAKKIIDQLRQGGNFVAYARQFSEASTASVGGDLGWLGLAQLPQSLANAAANMNANEVQAVTSPGGISILLLIDKRQVATSDPRDSVLSLKQIAITFPKGTPEAQVAPLVKQFSEETQQITGCGAADEMARKLGADVVNRDGIKIRELPAPLQQVMLDLQIGQSTPPYGSLQDGVRVFVLCGRDAPQEAASESFDEIMSRLEEERVNKRARIYLRDLRRDAVIEYN
ncbi:peptidyl-prolyl cis-trans isomerase SurA [Sphingorhabdus rigui]|uniref:Parvulin-like PPIase n=1 Tax=Sphingorhabdus rigui TaxID=1282858 RepID=A0A840AZH5_9SPHN|nr:peptidylprolyl isomerase [Sphingorhabdus rigui]MBB3943051.1 peptidyl-prolyl cis-trans isomerase SurA [Sphingorhabdus rigui]